MLAIVLGIVIGSLVVVAAAAGLLVHHVGRRNRVAPRVPTLAPLGWLWSWKRAARLHRRLRGVARAARAAVDRRDPWLALEDVTREIEARAVALDAHLVRVSRAPAAHRRALLREVDHELREVEALTARCLTMRPAVPTLPDRVGLRDRVDALEHALRELA